MTPRAWHLLLYLALGIPARGLSQPVVLQADSLEFFAWQATQAATPEQRLALNHIGIDVSRQDGNYVVNAVLDGYPAQDADVRHGDVLVSVNGAPYHPVYSFNPQELPPQRWRGSAEARQLELRRGDGTHSVTVSPVFENLFDSYRSAILSSVQEFAAGNKVIGYVRLWNLSRASQDLTMLTRLLAGLQHTDGLIIDLRNSLGYLDSTHLDLVFPSRNQFPVISGSTELFRAPVTSGALLPVRAYRKPLAVLINGSTRGGAELFAYQLGKLQRTTLLGESSPGMLGDFQADSVSPGASLRYRPARELLIDGLTLEGVGVTPDREVAYPLDQSGPGDPQFEFASNILMGTI